MSEGFAAVHVLVTSKKDANALRQLYKGIGKR